MDRDLELHRLEEEIDNLRASAMTQEAHLMAVTAEMDAMLRDIELQRNALAAAHAAAASGVSLLDRIIDTADDLIVFADTDGLIRRFNRLQVERLGLDPNTLSGATLDVLIDDADLRSLTQHLPLKSVESRGILFELVRAQWRHSSELHLRLVGDENAARKSAIWQLRAGVVLSPQGKLEGVVAIFTDITVWREAEADMRLAASVCQNIGEAIMVTDVDGIILSVNPAFTRVSGFVADEAVGKNPRLLKSDHHDQEFYAQMWRAIVDTGIWQGDIWNRRKTGELYLQRGTIRMIPDAAGRPSRYVYVFQDYTEGWQRDERTRHLAFHDPLTGLANRMLLESRLQQAIACAERDQRQAALLFIDLDGFKQVNDQMGHDVGDELLKVVAERLKGLVRSADTVSRIGGDEFILLLEGPSLPPEEIALVASRAVTSINQPIEIGNNIATVGASIGIAIFPLDGESPTTLMKNADQAMYLAKVAGKNTFRFACAMGVAETGVTVA